MNRTEEKALRDQMFKWKSIRDLLRTLSSSLLGFTIPFWAMVCMGMSDKYVVAIGMTIFFAIVVSAAVFAWRRLVYYRTRYEACT